MSGNRRRMSFSDWRSVLPSGHPSNSPFTASRAAISSKYRRISKARLRRARSKSVGHDDTEPSSPPRGVSDVEGFRRFAYEYDTKSDHGDLDPGKMASGYSQVSEPRTAYSSPRSSSFSALENDQVLKSNFPLQAKRVPFPTRNSFKIWEDGPSTRPVIRPAPRRLQHPSPQSRASQPFMPHRPVTLAIAKRGQRDTKTLKTARKASNDPHPQADWIAVQHQQLEQLNRVMEGLSMDLSELEKAIRVTHETTQQAFDV